MHLSFWLTRAPCQCRGSVLMVTRPYTTRVLFCQFSSSIILGETWEIIFFRHGRYPAYADTYSLFIALLQSYSMSIIITYGVQMVDTKISHLKSTKIVLESGIITRDSITASRIDCINSEQPSLISNWLHLKFTACCCFTGWR
jgi:hypothetical protein